MKAETKTCSKCKRVLPRDAKNFYRNKSKKDGFSTECKACNVRHQQSDKGKKTKRKYTQTSKGKKTIAIYLRSNKHKDTTRRYRKSNECKTCHVRYRQSDKGKKISRKITKTYWLKNKDKIRKRKVIKRFCENTALKPSDLPEEFKEIIILSSTFLKLSRNKRKELQDG